MMVRRRIHRYPGKRRMAGIAAVELALILPLLIMLALPIADFARAIQASMILINLSREGANLASRGSQSLKVAGQSIMGSLAATAPPLDMNRDGMMYITRIIGQKDAGGAVREVILEHYRWDDRVNDAGWTRSAYAPASAVWRCGAWAGDGACLDLPDPATAAGVNVMSNRLADGEVITVVESFYRFRLLFGGLDVGLGATPAFGPDLYSMTIF